MRRKQRALALALLVVMAALLADIWYVARGESGCRLPVLMYHHFAQESPYGTIVSFDKFREQMTAVKEAGYHAVTIPQIIDYVKNETPLPDKPVLITMDDGYTSNLTDAAPVLEELGLRATVFVIGVNEGETIYVHNGEPLSPPRFSYEEAAPWVEKGIIDVQSHTFDMHQLISYGYGGRGGLLRRPPGGSGAVPPAPGRPGVHGPHRPGVPLRLLQPGDGRRAGGGGHRRHLYH